MASDNVLGRLAKTGQMTLEDLFPTKHFAMPEQILWLAVIERALMDVIAPTMDMTVKHRLSLNWFFFSKAPRPFNLEYICEILFDYPDAANVVRKRLQELQNDPEQIEFARSKRYRGWY